MQASVFGVLEGNVGEPLHTGMHTLQWATGDVSAKKVKELIAGHYKLSKQVF